MTKSEHPKLIIRMPPDVKSWLADRAKFNERTMTGEILAILKDAKGGETKSKAASKSKVQTA